MGRLAALALAGCICATGCTESHSSSTSPTSPAAMIEAIAGSWTLGSSGSLPDGCTALDYTITKSADGQSGEIQFDGTCAGVRATGTGKGTLTGSTLQWTAEGTATRDGLTCPFKVAQGTAQLEGDGVRVTYAGAVCGVPVSGSDLLRRK
jgi:hypothetical protein